MTISDNRKLKGKTFVSGIWMDKNQLDSHLEKGSKQVDKFYKRFAKVAEYNTIH